MYDHEATFAGSVGRTCRRQGHSENSRSVSHSSFTLGCRSVGVTALRAGADGLSDVSGEIPQC